MQTLPGFHTLMVQSPFEIEWQEDTLFYVEMMGYKKSIDATKWEVKDSVLQIENTLKSKFAHPKTHLVKLVIHGHHLQLLELNETCNLRTRNAIKSEKLGIILRSKANFVDLEYEGNDLYYWNNFPCGGKLTLRGETDILHIWNTAILSVDAKNLVAKYGLVQNSSKGKCEVHLLEALDSEIKGEGNIEVYGNPLTVVAKPSTGTGQLIFF